MAGNIFAHIPPHLETELFETLVQGRDVKVERIVSRGHCCAPDFWYEQTAPEWVMLLKGAATVIFADGGRHDLRPGDYLNIPAGCRHRVDWTDPSIDTIWLAVHYG